MARPSKQQESADLRIRNAFWKILEEHEYKDITVGMIVDEANVIVALFITTTPILKRSLTA